MGVRSLAGGPRSRRGNDFDFYFSWVAHPFGFASRKGGVLCALPLLRVVVYLCLVEPRWIKQSRVKLRVSLHIKIIFVEGVVAVGIKLDARGYPACRELPIIPEAGVVNFRRVLFIRFDQSHEEKPLLLDPELFRLRIALRGAYYVNVLPIPLLFMNLRQIESLALRLVDRRLRSLAVHIKSQHQQHVNVRTRPRGFALLKRGQRPINKDEAVSLAGRAPVDAQLSRQLQGLVPDLRLAGAIWI